MSRRTNLTVKKSIYQISVATLIASLLWILISIYQVWQKPIDGAVEPQMLEPLKATIDAKTIDELMRRRQMSANDWTSLNKTIEIQPALNEINNSTESADTQGP